MKTAKLLGYSITTNNEGEVDGHDTGESIFTFYIELDGAVYFFTATESWGSCYSGYTGASWGDIDFTLHKTEIIIKTLTTPIKDIFINIVDGQIVKSIIDPKESWDAVETCVKSTDGEVIVSSTGDGGCQYYSSGVVDVNEELFNAVK